MTPILPHISLKGLLLTAAAVKVALAVVFIAVVVVRHRRSAAP